MVKPSQTPTAFRAMRPMDPQATEPPTWPETTETIPSITARMMIPSTSSITAAARMVTPSGESILRCSERIRAVMPTEVAMERTPKKRFTGAVRAWPVMRLPAQAPERKDTMTPPTPMMAPFRENRKKRARSVSSPEWKRRMIEATVARA